MRSTPNCTLTLARGIIPVLPIVSGECENVLLPEPECNQRPPRPRLRYVGLLLGIRNTVCVETQECEVVKRNAITMLGVVAMIAIIVGVRSAFQQTVETEEAAKAAAQAKQNLAEAAEISDEAKAEVAEAETATEKPDVPQDLAGYEPIDWAETAPDTFYAKFETTAGPFVIESNKTWAPIGHERFYELCKVGFFNDTGFFRVVPGFVVQFGLAADPKMTAQYKRSALRDEPARKSNQRGKVTFATSGPNSRTTQLFINYGDNANLDSMGFTPFGEVVVGMENVDNITSEYGEEPQQGSITSQGTAYLKQNFPDLDMIKQVVLVKAVEGAAPAPAPEAPAAEAPPAQ